MISTLLSDGPVGIGSLAILLAEEGAKNPLANYKPYLWAALIAALALFLLLRTQKRVMRGQRTRGMSVPERLAQTTSGSDVFSRIGEQMAQLAELSRQINGQIDSRIAKLELLIAEAERLIAQWEDVSGKSAEQLSQERIQGRSNDAAAMIQRISEKFQQQTAAADSDGPVRPDQTGGLSAGHAEADRDAGGDPGGSGQNNLPVDPKHQEVLELARRGLSSVDIARQLQRPVGEIELILSLSRKKQ